MDWIENGVPLDFKTPPPQFEEKNKIFKRKEWTFLETKIEDLIQSGCIKRVDTKPHCISRISTVPKKDGALRLITYLRHLNSFLNNNKKPVYENIDTVLNIVEPEDKLITLDIKDGFFHVKVDPIYHKYLGFSFKNKYYVWCVLPFGLQHSPYYFCKILRPVVQHLRQCDLRTVAYQQLRDLPLAVRAMLEIDAHHHPGIVLCHCVQVRFGLRHLHTFDKSHI